MIVKLASSVTVTVEPSHRLFTRLAIKFEVDVGQILVLNTAELETTVPFKVQFIDCNNAPFGKNRQHSLLEEVVEGLFPGAAKATVPAAFCIPIILRPPFQEVQTSFLLIITSIIL